MFDFRQIRRIRKVNDVTLMDLSKQSGVSHSNISNIELAKRDNTSVRVVDKILKPLGYKLAIVPIAPTQGTTITFKNETV